MIGCRSSLYLGRLAQVGLSLLLLLLGSALIPRLARAQFPGELRGQVVSASDGSPLGGALIEVPALGRRVTSETSGAYHLRGLEPGRYEIRVEHLGFSPWEGEVEIENGRATWLRIPLSETAIELEGLEVSTRRAPVGGVEIERAEIERSGARTAGDLVRRAPGIVLREEGSGGAQTVSIRGSGADAVLVLVDGVPLNDPVSGIADLSTIGASTIETITVLVGAQGARYGPRAEAGVVLIETRAAAQGLEGRLVGGSLGEWGLGAEGGAGWEETVWAAGVELRGAHGRFDYPRVAGVDETVVRRGNADLGEISATTALRTPLAGGEVRGRIGFEALDRGIPGKGYAPSPAARQELARLRGSLAWRGESGRGAGLGYALSLSGVSQRLHYSDPAPPFGLAYDDTTTANSVEARAELEGEGRDWIRRHGAGIEVLHQYIDAGALGDHAPRHRTDLGTFAHLTIGRELGGWDVEFNAELRTDRDAVGRRWYLNRGLGIQLSHRGLTLHLSNRSGYSPPSLGDQFFREGVAIEPNPDLRAERIPSEWEFGASVVGGGDRVDGALGLRVYQGDIRGMIVWLPDFRFVWSPRNTNVKRHGLEAWAEFAPGYGVQLSGSYSMAVVTYDRPGDDRVQVAYRPRHSAQAGLGWEGGPWRFGLDALFTGTRYPGPARLNALESFWTFRFDLGREWRVGRAELATRFQIDRLFDERDSLIFGFPEAGRRFRLEARARRVDR